MRPVASSSSRLWNLGRSTFWVRLGSGGGAPGIGGGPGGPAAGLVRERREPYGLFLKALEVVKSIAF